MEACDTLSADECLNYTFFPRSFRAVFTLAWPTHLLESRVVIMSCGSVHPSLLVPPRRSCPPSDLKVNRLWTWFCGCNLKKPDTCREEWAPACLLSICFGRFRSCTVHIWHLTFRMASHGLRFTCRVAGEDGGMIHLYWEGKKCGEIYPNKQVNNKHKHKGLIIQICGTSCGQVNGRGHFSPLVHSPTCVLIGHESVCLWRRQVVTLHSSLLSVAGGTPLSAPRAQTYWCHANNQTWRVAGKAFILKEHRSFT